MFKKRTVIFALASIFALPAFASMGEIEDDYGVEHSELDSDLQTNLGMTVSRDASGHIEVDDGNGQHYSYRLQAGAASGGSCTGNQVVCYREAGDGSGSLEVNYNTGRSETATAEAHNETELNEHALQLGYSVVSKTNGVLTVRETASGSNFQVRYAARMVRGAAGLNPGIRVENDGRIVERYSDGWEQEILPLR